MDIEKEIEEILRNFADYENHDEFHVSTDDCSNEIDEDEAKRQLKALIIRVTDEIIGEDEWEDPDIRGNKPEDYRDGSPADGVVTPWIRNWVKRLQRIKRDELLGKLDVLESMEKGAK